MSAQIRIGRIPAGAHWHAQEASDEPVVPINP